MQPADENSIDRGSHAQLAREDDFRLYRDYLIGRSLIGKLYRNWYLYPRLKRYLSGSVADVGCGIGDFLAARPNTVGFDINPHLIAHCTARGLTAQVIVEGRIPVPDESFDGLILDNVLEHLESPEALLAEIRRVLKTAGTLVVGVPGWKGFQADPDHKRHYEESILRATLNAAGFKAQRILHMPLAFPGAGRRLRQYCIYGVFQRIS